MHFSSDCLPGVSCRHPQYCAVQTTCSRSCSLAEALASAFLFAVSSLGVDAQRPLGYYHRVMSRKKTVRVYHYTAVFDPAPEGGYTVSVPALPGCISEGDTFEEARKNIREAMELYLEEMIQRKGAQRPPKDLPVVAPIEVSVPS